MDLDRPQLPRHPRLRPKAAVDDVEAEQRPQREQRRRGGPGLRRKRVRVGDGDVGLVPLETREKLGQAVLEGDRGVEDRAADALRVSS